MRKSFTSEFKFKVVLEALREESTLTEIASKYEIHTNQILNWKKQLLERAPSLFLDKRTKKSKQKEDQKEESLYKTIGVLKVENEFLRKKYKDVYGTDPG
jgi:transposase